MTKKERKQFIDKHSIEEFEERYVGKYKGHIRKVKSVFESAKFGIKNYNQIDAVLMSMIMGTRKPTKA